MLLLADFVIPQREPYEAPELSTLARVEDATLSGTEGTPDGQGLAFSVSDALGQNAAPANERSANRAAVASTLASWIPGCVSSGDRP